MALPAAAPARPNRRWRWFRNISLSIVLLGLGAIALILGRSQVESTAGGVHHRLLVGTGGERSIAVNAFGGTGEAVRLPGFLEGPVVVREASGEWSARWFCEDRVQSSRGRGDRLEFDCAGLGRRFDVSGDVPAPAAEAAMPRRVAVLSDLEGNHRFAGEALRRLGITDGDGRWTFADGHLVILGDSVDRGRDVFALLWQLHDLSAQAQAAGGAVHVLIGNHEQYILRGNISRAHSEHRYGLQQLGGYHAAFAADTVIGAWLRRQPAVLKLGDTLFVHGGLSPQVVASGLSIAGLNAGLQDYWKNPASASSTPVLEALFAQTGVTQYRGFLMPLPDFYPAATAADVDAALARFGAARIVVAHTQVPKVQALFDGRVLAVNVNSDEAASEVLLFEDGVVRVVDIALPRGLAGPTLVQRPFEFGRAADWALLAATVSETWALSRLPHPY